VPGGRSGKQSGKLMMKQIYTIFFIICLLTVPFSAGAQTVAVFPLLDLSKGKNGVNYVLTDSLRHQTSLRGYRIVEPEEVMDFMVRHRIRILGTLDSIYVSRAQKELEADYVMLGTVCQLKSEPNATVSVALQLVRTSDNRIIWSDTAALYQSELWTLLAVNDPTSLGDLYDSFFERLYATFPATPPEYMKGKDFIDIDRIIIRPTAVRSHDRVECRVGIKSTMAPDAMPEFRIMVHGERYPVIQDEDGHYLVAAWNAIEAEGKYHIGLETTGPDGIEEVFILGSYRIDNTPPEIVMHAVAPIIDRYPTFNAFITLTFTMPEPEQLSKWEFHIYRLEDEQEQTLVVFQEGAGQLSQRMTWNGRTSTGLNVPEGDYLIRVTVWDLVGNSGSDEQKVALRRNPPQLDFGFEMEENHMRITVSNSAQTPLNFWWMRICAGDGRVLQVVEGESFPAEVTVPLPAEGEEKLDLLVEARDAVGNISRRKLEDLVTIATRGEEEFEETEVQWLEDF
jgi:TolB-like protein